MPETRLDSTTFLNVDLDIASRQDLAPLVAALGAKVVVLHAARHGRTYWAHLELGRSAKSADATVRGLAALVRALPRHARRLWNTATVHDFNIGVQSATQPHAYEIPLAHGTIEAASALNARIVITIYAAEDAKAAKRRPAGRGRSARTARRPAAASGAREQLTRR